MPERILTREQFKQTQQTTVDKGSAAIQLADRASNLRRGVNPLRRLGALYFDYSSRLNDTAAKRARETVSEVRSMFYALDWAKTGEVFSTAATNARVLLGQNDLSNELINMGERNTEAAIEEYAPDVHSELAQIVESVAIFAGSKVKKPLTIHLATSQIGARWNCINEIIEGKDEYLERKGYLQDPITQKVAYIYSLLGFEQEVGNLPDLSKPRNFLGWHMRDLLMLDHNTRLTFLLENAHVSSVGPDQENHYFTPAATLTISKIEIDWVQPKKAPKTQRFKEETHAHDGSLTNPIPIPITD